MYETIPQPNFDTLQLITQRNMASQRSDAFESENLPCEKPLSFNCDSPARYVDKPVRISNSLSSKMLDENNADLCGSGSEKYDLQPYLTCTNAADDGTRVRIQSETSNEAGERINFNFNPNNEEAYTVMSPAGTVSSSISACQGQCTRK